MGSAMPPCTYPFACGPVEWVGDVFFKIIITTCSITFISLMFPVMSSNKFRPVRGFLFITLGISAAAPFIYLNGFADKRFTLSEASVMPWWYGGFCYIGGCLIYVFRFPEKWFPKTFDNFGWSHQIFHVGVVIGCAVHFNEGMNLYLMRKKMVCPIIAPEDI